MKLAFDGDLSNPEISLSDSISGLRELGNTLLDLKNEFELIASKDKIDFYSETLNKLIIKKSNLDKKYKGLLKIYLSGQNLVIEGDRIALNNLGHSILNCFNENTPNGYHIHLDYLEGHDSLVGPTNCHLIIEL